VSTAAALAPLEDLVRLSEPEFFMSYPFEVYGRMRREAPVFWSPTDQMWALTKYEDIRFVSKNPNVFSNRFGLVSAQCTVRDDGQPSTVVEADGCPMPRRAELRKGLMADRELLVGVDPPRHGFLRKIANYAFTGRAIARLEEHVADLAVGLLDRVEPGVEVDFINTVAAPVPMRVIAEMLGVATDRLDDFRRWSDAFIELGANEQDRTDEQPMSSRPGLTIRVTTS
jgi:cytochrome P450